MKAFKKVASILLALGLVAGFAACGGGKDEDTSSGVETSETVGVQVNETQMNAAIQTAYTATNLTITATGSEEIEGKVYSISCKYAYADGKMYGEYTSVSEGATEKEYMYAGVVDGVTYMWYSDDNQTWEVDEYPAEYGNPTSSEMMLETYFQWINYTYFRFDEETGMHNFTGLGSGAMDVKVVDGKIVEFRYEESQNDWIEAELTYGGATVGALPSLD